LRGKKLGYRVNFEKYANTFAVPRELTEKNIKIATEEQIKVLLCVLSVNSEVYPEVIADMSGVSVYETECALDFWVERGFLLSDGETTIVSKKAPEKKFLNVVSLEKPEYSECLKRAEESSVVADMLRQAQVMLGRTVSGSETQSLIFYHDTYGLPCEVILMMLGYAAAAGKQNFRYIDKVALDWAEKEINTYDKAEKYIDKLLKSREREYRLRKILSIGDRKLSQNEKKYIARWTEELMLSDELISVGYDRMVDAISKVSFNYLDKILTSFYQSGIKTAEEAEKIDISDAPKPPKKKKSSYNTGEVNGGIFNN
jgi:DnaD/phage-associated family protein